MENRDLNIGTVVADPLRMKDAVAMDNVSSKKPVQIRIIRKFSIS